jgi:hypothetical protein
LEIVERPIKARGVWNYLEREGFCVKTKTEEETVMVPLGKVRARLTGVWLLWSACIFTIVIVQSVLHKYGGGTIAVDGAVTLTAPTDTSRSDDETKEDRTADVWKWLLPNLLPTLTMMVSAVAASAFIQKEGICVRRDFYISAMGLSVFYLATLSGLLLCQPIANPTSATAQLKSLQTSNVATGPVQGLVAAALGVLFATGKPKEEETPASPKEDKAGDSGEAHPTEGGTGT